MKTNLLSNSSQAFSSVYEEYERLSKVNEIDISRRNSIRNHVDFFLKPNHRIIEINAGSGIDAVYFAQKGNFVLATDISDASENYINHKIETLGLTNLQFQKCSFTELQNNINEKFDYVFSNFGGLNCTSDLQLVCNQFNELLNPNGFITIVIMPPYYPWEMLTVLKGNKHAFRRWKKDGVLAKVGNDSVKTFYYTPNQVKKAMGKNFKHISTQNIGTFYPSSHFNRLQKYKSLISKLVRFDIWANSSPIMIKGLGDYFMITFQKTN